MLRRSIVLGSLLAASAIAGLGFTRASVGVTAGMTTGAAGLQSVGPLALGPSGVLFAGDSKGAAIYALALGDNGAAAAPAQLTDVGAKIAALLGVTRRDIVVNDMVANPRSGVVYFSIARGKGPDAQPAIVRVAPDGALQQIRLDSVTFSKLDLEGAPRADQPFVHPAWSNAKRRDYSVTALNFSDGELYVSGVTNEEFASSLRRVAFPFDGRSSVTKVSMYHTAHGMYETEAPIASFLPVTLGGQKMILAGYLCTPLATFPLKGLTAGGTLRGSTVIELGSGNGPRDIATFERSGEQYVVVATGRGWMARVSAKQLASAPALSTPVDARAGVPFVTPELKGVREIEPLANSSFLILQLAADSTLSMRIVDNSVF